MADREEGLTSPENTEDTELTDRFGTARESETPLERTTEPEGDETRSDVAAAFDEGVRPTTAETAGEVNPDGTVNVLGEDGQMVKVRRNHINTQGFYKYEEGDDEGIVHYALQQQDMGDIWGQMLVVLSHFLGGRWGEMDMAVETFFPRDVYVDPNDREQRISTLRDVVEDPEHPLRSASPQEFVQTVFGDLEPLRPHFDRLLGELARVESSGDANIIWDYRNRTDPGGNYPGLQPGDVTPGGLTVPDISTMTVNQVLAWQRQYLDEQIAAGIPADRRSTAAGSKQFTYTRLNALKEAGVIDGNRVFNNATQTELAIKSMFHDRGLNEFLSRDITVQDMINNIRSEWEGAQSIPTETLDSILVAMRTTAEANNIGTVSAVDLSVTR